MGMKVAAVSTLRQDARVFDAMWMAGTPCPYLGDIGDDAKKGWEDILNQQKDILTGLDYKISKVELSNNKGTYYRLKAGPYISRESAKESCKFLKAKKLYCKITDFKGLE